MAELKKDEMSNMEIVEYEKCEKTVKGYDKGYVDREYDEFEQVVYRIGDVAFSTFAFELFGEIGLGINTA